MPTAAQTEALSQLLATRTPLVVIETHEEPRVLALLEAVAKARQRELWTWSAARGLRVAHGLKLSLLDKSDKIPDANETQELPAALLVLQELSRTRPLSVTRAEAVQALRAWAQDRAVAADA